jgi:hypothetical protein
MRRLTESQSYLLPMPPIRIIQRIFNSFVFGRIRSNQGSVSTTFFTKRLKNKAIFGESSAELLYMVKKHYIFTWLEEKTPYIRGPIQDF